MNDELIGLGSYLYNDPKAVLEAQGEDWILNDALVFVANLVKKNEDLENEIDRLKKLIP